MKTVSLLTALVLAIGSIASAEERKLLFLDDFQDRTALRAAYSVKSEWSESFQVTDGVLVIRQLNPNHGAVLRKDLAFQDVDLEFDCRFSGGKSFNVVINDQQDKTVWSGHICRVSISPKKLTIGDDKTGSMNLEVRAQRLDESLSEEKKAALAALLAEKQTSVDVDLKSGQWRHIRIRIRGDTMAAWVGDKKVASLKSPGIAHPTKTSFGFTVNGDSIDFDNIQAFDN
ncbi:MAG: family 16 glycoside hydrolase [Planctomycetaceae bacterium]